MMEGLRFRSEDGELRDEVFVSDPEITAAVCRIMGGDVVRAVYAAQKPCGLYVDDDGDIRIDGAEVVVEMVNGRLVGFSSSEWASIASMVAA